MRTYEKLTSEGIIYNKRGIGYFISGNAREIIMENERKEFLEVELPAIIKKMELLGIDPKEIAERNNWII
jgi:DNA-binding transcriptional regulator YhcF (GntR family)